MVNHHSLGRVERGHKGWRFVLSSSFHHFQIKLFVFMQCYQHEPLSWKYPLTDSISEFQKWNWLQFCIQQEKQLTAKLETIRPLLLGLLKRTSGSATGSMPAPETPAHTSKSSSIDFLILWNNYRFTGTYEIEQCDPQFSPSFSQWTSSPPDFQS